jgi:2'-5' RNA ligase
MPRLFVSLQLPEPVQDALAEVWWGMPGARWTPPHQLHLTLRFIGDVPDRLLSDLMQALAAIDQPAFWLEVHGLGLFPGRGRPRVLWAGLSASAPLRQLQHKVERAVQRVGLPAERRQFHPHITLAKLDGAPPAKLAEFLAEHSLLRLDPFEVEAFQLMSSLLQAEGAEHTLEQGFPLR